MTRKEIIEALIKEGYRKMADGSYMKPFGERVMGIALTPIKWVVSKNTTQKYRKQDSGRFALVRSGTNSKLFIDWSGELGGTLVAPNYSYL